MKELIITIVVLFILYLIYKTTFCSDNFGIFNNESYFMSRPNCPQLNNDQICSRTPGCKLGKNGCINNLSDLSKYEKKIPEWMENDFMIAYDI
jgi:hypothetical protein